MQEPELVVEGVWKKFHKGQFHDSLRDLIPSMAKRLLGRGPKTHQLGHCDFWALRDISFRVGPGEALGVIGPNGAGKSTLLKILSRILRPDRGRVLVRGRVGALIEIAAGFHPDLTGKENVFLQGAIIGMKRSEVARKFDRIVDFSGIAEFIDTPIKRYSSGMNARLGFAIAAHLDTDLLLIDEVLAVGDMSFQARCYDRLNEIRDSGVPIVFVSHNLQAVTSLCDRAVLLRQGQRPVLGSTSEILSAYTQASSSSTDDRVANWHAEIVDSRERAVLHKSITPGEEILLRLDVTAAASLPRCGLAIHVRRSDGVLMFDGSSTIDGVPTINLPTGGTLRCTVAFHANVLRGSYFVDATLFDSQRRWSRIPLGTVASFVVHETTRWGGCAELAPRYDLQLAGPQLTQAQMLPDVLTRSNVESESP